ncbi:hypothetical protein FQR65_LT05747 [Abscondita terminalis]|nr:hypothetical protein FQR65_LT05747 [Abscondita terminalis]
MMLNIPIPIVRQYISALLVSIGIFVSGLATGWTGNITDGLLAGELNDITITITDLEWITSLPMLAGLIFSIPVGILCNKIGRKPTLLGLATCMIIGWMLIIFAKSLTLLFLGRFIIGAGRGPCSQIIPLYNVEIAEKDVRAKFGSFTPLLLNTGVFVAFILGYVTSIKMFTIICATISILYFLVLLYQDETPTYKIMQNDCESAAKILRRLRKESSNIDAEVDEIKMALQGQVTSNSLKEFLQKRSTKIAALVTSGIIFFQNTGGSAVVLYYPNEIFASAGSSLHPKHATIILGAIQVLTAMFGSSIIELFRRRVLLITSFLFASFGLVILGSYFTLRDRDLASEDTLSTFGFMPILGLIIFNLMGAIGVAPLGIVLRTELFPIETKAIAMSITGIVDWLLFFLITRFYIDFKMVVGGDLTFFIFAGMCFLGAVFSFVTVLETKVSVGIFVAGLATGWTGNITDSLLAREFNDIPIAVTDLEWITSLPTLAGLIFCIPVGLLCDKIGRKPTLLGLAVCTIIGWIFIVFAESLTLILVGRFVIGIGKGPCSQLIPLYNVEIAEKNVRAKFGSFTPLLLNTGVFVAFILGYVTSIKIFTIVCAAISVLYFLVLLFQNETPTYKMMRKDYDNAKKVLQRLRKKSYDVDAEMEEIKVALQGGSKRSLRESLQKRSTKIATLVACGILFFQNAGGFAVVLYYPNEIFTSAGSSLHPKHATIILGAIRVLTAIFGSTIIELFRRRVLLITSFLSTSIGLVILGSYFTLRDQGLVSEEMLSTLGFMPLLGLIIFILMGAIGVAPLAIVLRTELFPIEAKAVAMSFTGIVDWLLYFLMTRFYIDLKMAVGGDVTFYIFAVSVGMFLSGMAAGWTGNITEVLLAGEYNNITITVTELEWITSLPILGGLIFCIPVGILCDKIGRKPALLGLAACTIVGWLFVVFAKSLAFIYVGRFFVGIGKGSSTQLIPLYIVEIAGKNVRAKFGSFTLLLFNIGVFASFALGYVTGVKVLTIICVLISVLYFMVLLYLNETPTYKIMTNDYDSARTLLRKLGIKSHDVDTEIAAIKIAIQAENRRSLKEILQKRNARIAAMVTCGVTFFLNTGGFPVAIYYPSEIFASTQSSVNPKHATIILGGIQVMTAILGSGIIELFRRRLLLINSFFFSSIGMVALGSYFTLRDRSLASEDVLSTLKFLPLLGLIFFYLISAIGISPLAIVLRTELFPIEAKAVAMSITGIVDWLLFFLITRFYIDLKMAVGGDVTFYIFAGMCILGGVFSYVTVPETKNKTLEQIQIELNRK